MTVTMTPKIVSVTELRRRFGEITAHLIRAHSIILTRDGKPFATLRPVKEIKMTLLRRSFGAWKNTALDNDKLWAAVSRRKSRLKPIRL